MCLIPSCTNVRTDKEKQRLQAAYKEHRKALLLGDFVTIAESCADSIFLLQQGNVVYRSRSEIKDSLQKFFRAAQYDNWDDLQPPIMRISDDATMGWIIYKVYLRRLRQNDRGSIDQEEFIESGMDTFEKQNGRWIKTANLSSRYPK